ncbi:MAG: hypothetical protein IT381_10065 [Deltaproteobacteria bacterium]|nr:hypothetical protein [Deltaproteobacteria bacterium]
MTISKPISSTTPHSVRHDQNTAAPAEVRKPDTRPNGRSHDGVDAGHAHHETHGGTRANSGGTGVASSANKAIWGGRLGPTGGIFERAKLGATEHFSRLNVETETSSRWRRTGGENDEIYFSKKDPDFNLVVPSKDDKTDYLVFKIAEGADAAQIAKDMAATLKRERGYKSTIKANADGTVDLQVVDKAGKPVRLKDRMTDEIKGIVVKGSHVTIPKQKPPKPSEVTITLPGKKLKLPVAPFEAPKDTAKHIAAAIEREGYAAKVKIDADGGASIKVSDPKGLAVDVYPADKSVTKIFYKAVKYAEVSGDGAAIYALKVDPKRLQALETGDPSAFKVFLLKALHGIDNFSYGISEKDVSGKDVIKGADVAIGDTDPAYKNLRPKDGLTWKILDRSQLFDHGLRYIFEDDDTDFVKALAENKDGEQAKRAKLEDALREVEAVLMDFKPTSLHMVRIPDNGVGSAYGVIAVDSKSGTVRIVGNYFEPGGPPNGAV